MRKLITVKKQDITSFWLAVVLIFCCHASVLAQSRTITGNVTDVKGEPLIGVTVKVKGSTKGTSTDFKGDFKLTVDGNPRLVFYYIGFEEKEVALNGQTTLKVSLKETASQLNEVVVTGYSTVLRRDLPGSVGNVKLEDLQKAPVKSFDEALGGRVAGVQVTSTEGQPGSTIDIVIRGNNSITQGNSPLFVIDGFLVEDHNNSAVNPLNTIDPSDIASIIVLKDASATSIYGARGANGVIEVTTKRGKIGSPTINYETFYGWQENKKRMEVLSPYEFVKLQNDIDPVLTNTLYFKNGELGLEDYRNIAGINWEDQVTKVAPMQKHYLSMNGGTDKTKYSASLSYLGQDGIILNSGFNRTQGRASLDQQVSKKLKVGFNSNYAYIKNYGSPTSTGTYNNEINLLFSVWAYRPVATSINVDLLNEETDPEVASTADFRYNPILTTRNELRENYGSSFNANGYAEYQFDKYLKLKVMGTYNKGVREYDTFNGSQSRSGNPQTNYKLNGSKTFLNSTSWVNTNTLNYLRRFNKRHLVNALAGFTTEGGNSSMFGAVGVLLPNESLGLSGLDEGTPNSIISSGSEYTMLSFLGRMGYTLDDKYAFTATMRADGSSRFLGSNRWGYFPSASFVWHLGKEKFMQEIPVVSSAKLRTSWGLTGNNGVGNFAAFPSLVLSQTSGYMFNNSISPGIYAGSLGNRDLKWETTEQTDLGIDLGFLKDRLNFTADIYRKNTRDLLLNADLPPNMGYDKGYKNIGRVRNQGLELGLSGIVIKGKKFNWESNFNISFNRNKVLALTENQTYMLTPQNWGDDWKLIYPYVAMVDAPISQFYGYIWDGVYKYDDFVKTGNTYALKNNITANGESRAGVQPGDIKYRDINGDLLIDEKDKVIIGQPYPKHTGGFSNNFGYKGFSLNVFFQWSYGNDIINANRLMLESGYKYNTNQFASYVNRWTPENPDSNIPAVKGSTMKAYSTRIIEDGSFLRLKTVSLGYAIPKSIASKLLLKNATVNVSAQNLHTWTSYSGYDPEVGVRNSALTPGFDYSAYPRARTITLGLNASF